MTLIRLFLLPLIPLVAASTAFAQSAPLQPGERIVLLGNALIEHERLHGYIETRLRRHAPGAKIIVRNLGWAGDTIRGEARSGGFQNPEGMPRLIKEVKELKPTIIFVGYGMNESFAGIEGLAGFLQGYDKLLGDLATTKARLIILSPTWHEDLGRPLPDPTEHNKALVAYTAALRTLAEKRKLPFIDLHHALAAAKTATPTHALTSNGILLNELGYWHMAAAIEKQLGSTDADERVGFRWTDKDLAPTLLMAPPQPGTTPAQALVVLQGLPAGRHTLKLSGVELTTAAASDWEKGVRLPAAPFIEDIEALRKSIVMRNDLFFRGWRPFNDHSRHWGFMAKDFKLFAEMVERQDDVIDNLRIGRVASLAIVAGEKTK